MHPTYVEVNAWKNRWVPRAEQSIRYTVTAWWGDELIKQWPSLTREQARELLEEWIDPF